MRHHLLWFAAVGTLCVLTGCTSMSSSSALLRTSSLVQPTHVATHVAPRPTASPPDKHRTFRLPEAGAAQTIAPGEAIKPPATPTVTPPSPTPLPVTSTATPAQPPIVNSPTPNGYPASAIPIRLLIPAINLDVPVVAMGWSVVEKDGQQVSEWDVPGWRAAGWLKTSALIGAVGNTVLEGHQDIAGRVFENLEYLKEGDEIQVQTEAQTRRYRVTLRTSVPEKNQPLAVQRENARWIGPSNDERLTLVTCWPRNDNTRRLILVALPAP